MMTRYGSVVAIFAVALLAATAVVNDVAAQAPPGLRA